MNRNLGKHVIVGLTLMLNLPVVQAGFFNNSAMEPNEYVETRDPWSEQEAALPAMPHDDDLMQIEFESASGNVDFIDRSTLEVGEDQITRVTLLTRHKSGAQTLTREGIRCETGEYRIYAIGSGGEWSVPKASVWRPIHLGGYNSLRSELYETVLCKNGFPKKPDAVVKDLLYPPEQKNW